MIRAAFVVLLLSALTASAQISFEYDQAQPLDLKEPGTRQRSGVTVRDTRYLLPNGSHNAVTIVKRTESTAPRPVLLRFAKDDERVSPGRAAAANELETVRAYEAKHELNEVATHDRIAWLKQQLKLGTP